MAKSRDRSVASRLWKYHASISGSASFIISEGWKRTHADVQPAPRAVHDLAEQRHRDQQHEADDVDRHREAHQRLRRDLRRDPHRRERDADVDELGVEAAGES